jgi:hypothetical protein
MMQEEKDIPKLSREIGGTERSLFIVLEALLVMGYVNKNKTKYIIAEKARPLFIQGGDDYVGGYLPHFLNKMKAWLELPLIVKGEKPGREKPQDISAFMNAMASKPDTFVEQVIGHCIERKKEAKTVLDLGGGPGKYAKAFVNKGISAVIYDMPEIIDIVFMGNICHIYSKDEMFAVNMLANTERGNTYREAQYRKWLEDAGFHSIEILDIPERENQLITAFSIDLAANET